MTPRIKNITTPSIGVYSGVITGVGAVIDIGTSTAKAFCREGIAHLYLVDIITVNHPSLVSSLQYNYPTVKITSIQADAASSRDIGTVIDRVMAEEGKLDLFFANAGIMQVEEEGKMTQECYARGICEIGGEEFLQVIRVNTLSGFVALKAASKAMLITKPSKGKTIPGGSIVLTSSVAALGASAAPLAYDVSKSGVIALAKAASYALAGTNIRVNSVSPGTIMSNLSKFVVENAQQNGTEDQLGRWCNNRRFGDGSELSHTVLFLMSDEASYVNGHNLVCDGGWTSNIPSIYA
ncbi:hypothetical protein IAT38_007071 [Cryptococcus sp. DSM 104549]